MYQMKNKSVINAPHNSAFLLPTSGNRARNALSQLAANLEKLNLIVVPASPVVRHRCIHRYHCHDAIVLQVSTSVRHKHWWGVPLPTKHHTPATPFHQKLNLWLVRRPVMFTTSTRPGNHSSTSFKGYASSSIVTGVICMYHCIEYPLYRHQHCVTVYLNKYRSAGR